MIVLGIDTALKACSVAILRGSETLFDKSLGMEKGHAEHLAPLVCEALETVGVVPADIDRVGVVAGPGGFTGVRVGLAFARSFVLGRAAAAVGVCTLAALGASARSSPASGVRAGLIAPVVDARRGEVYAALFDPDGATLIPAFVADPVEAAARFARHSPDTPVDFIGSGAALVPLAVDGWRHIDGAAFISAVSVARLAAGQRCGAAPAPVYLRGPDAKPGGGALLPAHRLP